MMRDIMLDGYERLAAEIDGGVTLLRPVRVWCGTADEEDDRQPGIPPDAQNVRMCGTYLKCDSLPGSWRASNRVDCPYGEHADVLRGLSPILPHPEGDIERIAGYTTRVVRAPRTASWSARILLAIDRVGVRRVGDAWHWAITATLGAEPRRDPVRELCDILRASRMHVTLYGNVVADYSDKAEGGDLPRAGDDDDGT